MTFSQKTLEYVYPGSKVLDLGAGDGWFSRECVARLALVTAVDTQPAVTPHPQIDWDVTNVKDYLERLPAIEMFDVIFSRNLVQFLDTDWVKETMFPMLLKHLSPNGVIAIQTFYQDPEPPFESKVTSLFTLSGLKDVLLPTKILNERQFSETSPDMNGVTRTFFVTNIIAQKSS